MAPRRGRTPGKDKNKIGTPARGDIMRGVNIHADFLMIQCTKNKILTSLSHPLCHPAIRRGSVNFYSIPPVPPLRGFTGGYHMPPRHAARLQDSARLRLPSSPCGLLRGWRHLPDKLKFIALPHLSTVILNSAIRISSFVISHIPNLWATYGQNVPAHSFLLSCSAIYAKVIPW